MIQTEFDEFADEYLDMHKKNIRVSGENPEYFSEYKIKDVSNLLASDFPDTGRILDFGAGVGGSLPYFKKYFSQANLTCLDVSAKSLAIARERFPDQADFKLFGGQTLPFSDNFFDLIFAACVFHHIPRADHVRLLGEWHRVLKPGGMAVIFEHNPLNPLTVQAVNTCPFDQNAELISAPTMKQRMVAAGFGRVRTHYRVFIPGALRILRPVERWLNWCPFGAQYMTYAVKQGDTPL
ncbi:class I SAM-dependent methyltransferase [Methylomagnum sp.]